MRYIHFFKLVCSLHAMDNIVCVCACIWLNANFRRIQRFLRRPSSRVPDPSLLEVTDGTTRQNRTMVPHGTGVDVSIGVLVGNP